jgi:hypothetical protein
VLDYTQPSSDQAFRVSLYADQLDTLNQDNMDPGHIGCNTTTEGSGGILGLLEPESAEAFQNNIHEKPFKLTEDYFACTPKPMTAFFEALGIAQGNATICFGLAVMCILFVANMTGVANAALSDDDVGATSRKFAEALHFTKDEGKKDGLTNEGHKELQALLKAFLAKDFTAADAMDGPKKPLEITAHDDAMFSKIAENKSIGMTEEHIGSRI